MATNTFDERLRRFYDDCDDEERDVVSFMCASALLLSRAQEDPEVTGFENDPAQMFQQILQQLTQGSGRSTNVRSSISNRYDQALSGLAMKLKG